MDDEEEETTNSCDMNFNQDFGDRDDFISNGHFGKEASFAGFSVAALPKPIVDHVTKDPYTGAFNLKLPFPVDEVVMVNTFEKYMSALEQMTVSLPHFCCHLHLNWEK